MHIGLFNSLPMVTHLKKKVYKVCNMKNKVCFNVAYQVKIIKMSINTQSSSTNIFNY